MSMPGAARTERTSQPVVVAIQQGWKEAPSLESDLVDSEEKVGVRVWEAELMVALELDFE